MSTTNETPPTPTRGVPVTLDRVRHLRFSLRTMKELRKEFGEEALTTGLEQDAVAKLVWYGLRHEDPELTVEDVEDLVDLEQLSDVMEAVAKATGQRGSLTLLHEAEELRDKVKGKDLGTDEAVSSKIEELSGKGDQRPPEPAPKEKEAAATETDAGSDAE